MQIPASFNNIVFALLVSGAHLAVAMLMKNYQHLDIPEFHMSVAHITMSLTEYVRLFYFLEIVKSSFHNFMNIIYRSFTQKIAPHSLSNNIRLCHKIPRPLWTK